MFLKIKKNFFCEESGFSIVELLAAIMIMSVVLVPMISAYLFSWKTSRESFRRTTALMLARWKISQLRSEKGFSDVSSQNKSDCVLPPPYDEDDGQESIYVEYNCTVDVEDKSGADPNFASKKVNIKIYFDSLHHDSERTIFCMNANDCDQPDFSTFFAKLTKS